MRFLTGTIKGHKIKIIERVNYDEELYFFKKPLLISLHNLPIFSKSETILAIDDKQEVVINKLAFGFAPISGVKERLQNL